MWTREMNSICKMEVLFSVKTWWQTSGEACLSVGLLVYWSSNQDNLYGVLLLILGLELCLEPTELSESFEIKKMFMASLSRNVDCWEYVFAFYCGLVLKAHTLSLMSLCRLENIILGLLMLIIMSSLTCYSNHLKNCLLYYCCIHKICSFLWSAHVSYRYIDNFFLDHLSLRKVVFPILCPSSENSFKSSEDRVFYCFPGLIHLPVGKVF